jgi:hypothetical protein
VSNSKLISIFERSEETREELIIIDDFHHKRVILPSHQVIINKLPSVRVVNLSQV